MGCVASLLIGLAMFATLYHIAPILTSFQAGVIGALWSGAFLALAKAVGQNLPRDSWRGVPINHYRIELFVPTEDPRQLKRDKVELDDDEIAYLRANAPRIVNLEWRYTTRAFENYDYWRDRFVRWGWAYFETRARNSPIAFTRGGKTWLRKFANAPPPEKVCPISHEIPGHTHQIGRLP